MAMKDWKKQEPLGSSGMGWGSSSKEFHHWSNVKAPYKWIKVQGVYVPDTHNVEYYQVYFGNIYKQKKREKVMFKTLKAAIKHAKEYMKKY